MLLAEKAALLGASFLSESQFWLAFRAVVGLGGVWVGFFCFILSCFRLFVWFGLVLILFYKL